MSKKRKGAGDGHQNGGHVKRWKSQQRGQLQGPGILITTLRRKEKKAALELVEFLKDIVDELYPDLDLSTLPEKPAGSSQEVLDDDDSLDMLSNGKAPAGVGKPVPVQKSEGQQIDAKIPADDIEAQIQAELQGLQSHKSNKKGRKMNEGASKEAFEIIDLEVECLAFITVAKPIDPVKLCCFLLDQVANNGQVRGKFIQRLSPIYMSCRADILSMKEMATEVFSAFYPEPLRDSTVSADILIHTVFDQSDFI